MKTTIDKRNGKTTYEEVFVSNAKCSDKNEAKRVLESIRENHKNWKEYKDDKTGIFKNADGTWSAQRHHYIIK